MSDTKASPGPWRWDPEYEHGWLTDRDGNAVISTLAPADSDVADANKSLIASAPAMLAMLEELEWRGSPAGNECPECEHLALRRVNVPGETIPGMPGMVRYTGETKEIPGGHAPDCKLAILLADLRKP